MSCFGPVLLYVLSLAALSRSRRDEPELQRPYRAPLLFAALTVCAALHYAVNIRRSLAHVVK